VQRAMFLTVFQVASTNMIMSDGWLNPVDMLLLGVHKSCPHYSLCRFIFSLFAFLYNKSRQLSEEVDRGRFPVGPRIFLSATIFRLDMESFKLAFPEVKLSGPSAKVQNTVTILG
jgi:hypothetical protein